jgi:tetratricopeptide (TPR) repeat protein
MGDEAYNQFRGPGFAEWDTAVLKRTLITERVNLQLRFEFYNVFNRVNLHNVDTNLPDYQPALDLLCQLEFRSGNIEEPIELTQKAIARNPKDETAMYQEMMAYRYLGKKNEVNQLVARLKRLKEQQQSARMNYQL